MSEQQDLIFKSLADPTRRHIFEQICREGPCTVTALTRGAGVRQPVVSRHLAQLKAAGMVTGIQSGRQTHYHLSPGALAPLRDWTARMAEFWTGRFGALEDLLNRMDQ